MGEAGYTSKAWLPEDIRESASTDELLAYINSIPAPGPAGGANLWHWTSLVMRAGKYYVLDGDQIAFIATTAEEAHAYLLGRATATVFVMHMYSSDERNQK